MRKLLFMCGLLAGMQAHAQTNPAITSWYRNTTGIVGRHYISGGSTPITDTAHANVQVVQYSATNAYVSASGIPSYIVGPYLDGNPSLATNRAWIFKIPLSPTPQTGTQTSVPLGSIAVLVNGVPLYSYADARSYNNLGIWHQDAIYFEKAGFDCAKGHPSPVGGGMGGPPSTIGSYHHHQNPSAFRLDKVVISTVCDLYLADGLYVMDSMHHSPLLGYAFDGYPIYGAYGYKNTDGTGGIRRMHSSYRKRAITDRTTLADGTVLTSANYGPTLADKPLGAYMEDYEYAAGSGDLDEHNGRFAVTPEYPSGTYAYYTTVDANQNSEYPYVIGPKYYGVVNGGTVTSVTETTTTYTGPTSGIGSEFNKAFDVAIYPNPASDLIALQVERTLHTDLDVTIFDMTGRQLLSTKLNAGSTMCHLDTRTLYNGDYLIVISNGKESVTRKVAIVKE